MEVKATRAVKGQLSPAADKRQQMVPSLPTRLLQSWPSRLLDYVGTFPPQGKGIFLQQAQYLWVAGKLGRLGQFAAVAARLLVHIQDEISGRRFLVDTGASSSIWPYSSILPASGPWLFGPAGQPINCWGEPELLYSWSFRAGF
jgi:hypothetical protein